MDHWNCCHRNSSWFFFNFHGHLDDLFHDDRLDNRLDHWLLHDLNLLFDDFMYLHLRFSVIFVAGIHHLNCLCLNQRNWNFMFHFAVDEVRYGPVNGLFNLLHDFFWNLDDSFYWDLVHCDPRYPAHNFVNNRHLNESVPVDDLRNLNDTLDLAYLNLWNFAGDDIDVDGSWRFFDHLLNLWNLNNAIDHQGLRDLNRPFHPLFFVPGNFNDPFYVLGLHCDVHRRHPSAILRRVVQVVEVEAVELDLSRKIWTIVVFIHGVVAL